MSAWVPWPPCGISRSCLLLALLCACTSLFGCINMQAPSVSDPARKLATFTHLGNEQTCAPCHEKARPAPSAGVPHGQGGDCIQCHRTSGWRSGVAAFNHSPLPSACATCHESARPTTVVGSFSHQLYGMGDCVSCHAAAAGVSWLGASFSHTNTLQSCADCHSAKRPTAPVNGFDHGVAGTGDCIFCHAKNVGSSWAGGFYDHTPAPATCAGCHAGRRPTAPVNGFSHASGGMGDCVSCHKNPGGSWAGGVFSHNPVPATCADCHATKRPGAVVNNFDHATAGLGDCVYCHASGAGTTWATGAYSHVPQPAACFSCHGTDAGFAAVKDTVKNQMKHAAVAITECVACHGNSAAAAGWASWKTEAVPNGASAPLAALGVVHGTRTGLTVCQDCHTNERPAAAVSGFDHRIAGMGDCVSCHKVNIGLSWAGGAFSHNPAPATCASCHSAQRPAALVNGFNHSLYGTADCAGCHRSPGVSWAGGTFSHSPAPTACATCHGTQRPTAVVNKFSHSAYGMGDCVSCHKNPGASWAGGIFSHSPAPADCASCHSAQRPGTVVNNFSHSNYGMGDCVSCHRNPGVSWAGGVYSHSPAPTGCYGCHAGDATYTSISGSIRNQMKHSAISITECAGCHANAATTARWANWVAETVANGAYGARAAKGVLHSAQAPTACAACHANEVPAGTVPNSADGFNHPAAYGTECAGCHTVVAANTGLRWSGGFFNHNNNNAAGFTNCSPCHDTKKHYAGRKCTDCHAGVLTWPTATKAGAWGKP